MPLAAPLSSVAVRPTNPVVTACAKNVPMPTNVSPASTAGRLPVSSSGSPIPASASAPQIGGRMPNA